ncbi:MAG: HEPN domain-containing protein [Thermoprotei archaeon]
MLDWEEYLRWLESAEKTLESAKREIDNNWSCFKAEQSAQLAIKGLLILLGKDYFGHDMLVLIKKTEINVEKDILESAMYLGRLYITTRYPDALPGSTPYVYYTEEDKRKAIECAEKILDWVKSIGENLKRKEKAKK